MRKPVDEKIIYKYCKETVNVIKNIDNIYSKIFIVKWLIILLCIYLYLIIINYNT